MSNLKNPHKHVFTETCEQILAEHPDAIGVAFRWLDCGCVMLCGVSAKGNPVGQLVHTSEQAPHVEGKSRICRQCRKDGGLDRVVWQGIHWPGDENELPDKDLRLTIGRMVFGPGYAE
jgi:hypothetical protein